MKTVKTKKERFELASNAIEKRIYEAEKSLKYHKDQAESCRELIDKLQQEYYKMCETFKNEK